MRRISLPVLPLLIAAIVSAPPARGAPRRASAQPAIPTATSTVALRVNRLYVVYCRPGPPYIGPGGHMRVAARPFCDAVGIGLVWEGGSKLRLTLAGSAAQVQAVHRRSRNISVTEVRVADVARALGLRFRWDSAGCELALTDPRLLNTPAATTADPGSMARYINTPLNDVSAADTPSGIIPAPSPIRLIGVRVGQIRERGTGEPMLNLALRLHNFSDTPLRRGDFTPLISAVRQGGIIGILSGTNFMPSPDIHYSPFRPIRAGETFTRTYNLFLSPDLGQKPFKYALLWLGLRSESRLKGAIIQNIK